MILRKILIENIRSYAHQELEFPEGSVLLSGDIGSGKSTILLAVDFALFGIQKDLSGASLLRHGKENGSVELDFEVGGKTYTIKRTLKRKNDAVRQSSAYIIQGGVQKDLTAQEAKYFILDLLGYPAQALRKDSALIYRYTVYTPQEQMRHIIDADAAERLDLIRRLFGIDKYKRIAENAEIFAKELRGRVRELSGTVSDLEQKRKERKELEGDAGTVADQAGAIKLKLAERDKALLKKKQELDALQERIQDIQKKKQEYASLKKEFDMLKESADESKEAATATLPKLKELEQKLAGLNALKKPETTPQQIEGEISKLEREEKDLLSKTASLKTEVASLSVILQKGVCGTCRQKVADSESFKKGIESKEGELAGMAKKQTDIRARLERLRRDLKSAQEYDSVIRERKSLEDRKLDLTELKTKHEGDFKDKQGKLKAIADELNAIAREIKGEAISQNLKDKQKEYEDVRSAREELKRQESALEQKIAGLKERIGGLDKEIRLKELSQKRMEEFTAYDRWLRDFFVKLMQTIEKHVLVNVQHEFNSLFQKWFSMLVMDEGLTARVDDGFSIIIEQDGFESDYSFMSGGERTAIALAYRLALNRVINDLTEKIRTKDLVILDEPTDGFSGDQMNSVRDVLDELNTRQTIIVSHEPKIESFVGRTIRFIKENGTSRAL